MALPNIDVRVFLDQQSRFGGMLHEDVVTAQYIKATTFLDTYQIYDRPILTGCIIIIKY
jgi:hypothetical protein